ncbi:MAG: PfkB family carbohydrate kinase [Kiritimatiellae bacterium]|nr:PfkB family carbohydrate kinase [Kiritimatiellia bacterium]MDD4341261.1 PfkB family carbohydrate kinase [Kiritimatiellia bacterium]
MPPTKKPIQDDSRAPGKTVPPAPVLLFGEVLFDGFPDGRRVLGGAPFNVAWGLQGFGRAPLLVSAVGEDADGRTVRDRMTAWGLRTDGVQTNARHATGEVQIELKGGEPRYDICMPRAWDVIGDDGFAAAEILYHGLLALRNEVSRQTLEAIRGRSSGAVRFFDINLRPPYDSRERLLAWMQGADWLKLNLDELAVVRGEAAIPFAHCEAPLERLRSEHDIGTVLLTAGAEGLLIHGDYGHGRCSPAPPVLHLVDTVGAGDSISAVAIDGILRGVPAQTIVETAGRFASKICGLNGAVSEDKEFYRHG